MGTLQLRVVRTVFFFELSVTLDVRGTGSRQSVKTMAIENTGPIYLKERHFNRNGYAQQLQQNLFDNPEARTGHDAFNSKRSNENKFEIQDDLGKPVNYVRIQDLEDNIRKEIVSDKNSLHRAIKPVLFLAQCFAILPVQGIDGQNTSYLAFSWFSWQVMYFFFVISSCLILIVFSILNIIHTELTYESTDDIAFLGGSLVLYIIFLHLARQWPKFMKKWELMEREIRHFGYLFNTAFKFKILTSIIFTLSLIEHSVSISTGVMRAIPCSTGGLDIFRVFFLINYRQVFSLIRYSFLPALFIIFVKFILSCAWNIMDLFIIILSCAVSDKFKQINKKLETVKGKVLPSAYWRKSREGYNQLASLTEDMDELLSPVVLLSFAHNLYFICLQLLNSLKPMHGVWQAICFLFLFTYLVGRTMAVSLFAAAINDQSKKPKSVLFSVPTESYGVEVARYLTQVTANELALTGCNFFSVTRTFMLTVVGTIVTYEIVLIQFNTVATEVINPNETLSYCP